MRTTESIRTKEGIEDGSSEDIQFSYGTRVRDPLEGEKRAQLQEQRHAKHKWLGRLLTVTSMRNPAQTEQRMRNDIEAARRVTHPQPWAGDQHSGYIGQPQATVEQLQDSAHQQPGQQPIHDAPAEAANHYVPRHAAKE